MKLSQILLVAPFMLTNIILLGMNMPLSRKIVTTSYLRQRYPYLQYNVQQPNIVSNIPFKVGKSDFDVDEEEPLQTHLIPTDNETLKLLDLCPLFAEQKESEFKLDKDLLTELDEETIKQLYAAQSIEGKPKYHIFNGATFETRHIMGDAPCVVKLGALGKLQRTLMQLKSLDQFELAKKTSLSPALCAGHALNNSRLIRNYVLSGELKYLKQLHDLSDAAGFLLDLEINDWLNIDTVKANIEKVGQLLGVHGIDISAVSTVALFDSTLKNKNEFALYDAQEYGYVQKIKHNIQQGLKDKNYIHLMVIGNEEAAVSHGHYFCFGIIKSGDEMQYVVLDTMPGVYHLQQGSHERDRLMFIIDNIEKGQSAINLGNLRTQWLQSFEKK
jgi:hypothetical protein